MCDSIPKIPVSVIVVTKNEERRIGRCLDALCDFSEVIVVDSKSDDQTCAIAESKGARVVDFEWNGAYPKKRGWCLAHIKTAHDWVFWVDADEIITPSLVAELRALDFKAAGYFVRGRYVFEGAALRHGLQNNKLALMNRRLFVFPVIDDLDIAGMGEIEGHYQPQLKPEFGARPIGQLRAPLLHDAYDDVVGWHARHRRYAMWEREMDLRGAWPDDVRGARRVIKSVFKAMPQRAIAAFVHCYILKLGIFDGGRGFRFARSRYQYYRMIS